MRGRVAGPSGNISGQIAVAGAIRVSGADRAGAGGGVGFAAVESITVAVQVACHTWEK